MVPIFAITLLSLSFWVLPSQADPAVTDSVLVLRGTVFAPHGKPIAKIHYLVYGVLRGKPGGTPIDQLDMICEGWSDRRGEFSCYWHGPPPDLSQLDQLRIQILPKKPYVADDIQVAWQAIPIIRDFPLTEEMSNGSQISPHRFSNDLFLRLSYASSLRGEDWSAGFLPGIEWYRAGSLSWRLAGYLGLGLGSNFEGTSDNLNLDLRVETLPVVSWDYGVWQLTVGPQISGEVAFFDDAFTDEIGTAFSTEAFWYTAIGPRVSNDLAIQGYGEFGFGLAGGDSEGLGWADHYFFTSIGVSLVAKIN